MMLFILIAAVFVVTWIYSHAVICAEIACKNKMEFYRNARQILSDPNVSDRQKEKIYKWADTIESKRHAYCFYVAISQIYNERKNGKPSQVDSDIEEYTDEIAGLFVHWMIAQMYSIPFATWCIRDRLMYILSDDRTKVSTQVKVNRDIFRHEMRAAA